MDRIIRFHEEPHEQVQKLLPWYVIGQLDADEAAELEAHLAGCAEFQAELQSERALGNQVSCLSIDVERGWAALRQRIQLPSDEAARSHANTAVLRTVCWPIMARWILGAQAAAIAVLGLVIAAPEADRSAQYHALGPPSASNAGNMIVVFRPETPERELRRLLIDSGARLVDGPTTADAYVLRVAEAGRAAALAKLRSQADVVLAEPIDASERE